MDVALANSLVENLPTWLAVAALVGGAWIFRRGGGGTALGSLVEANRVLEDRVKQLEDSGRIKDREISELRGRTDVGLALQPLIEWSENHEQRAEQRHAATLSVLEKLADRLAA